MMELQPASRQGYKQVLTVIVFLRGCVDSESDSFLFPGLPLVSGSTWDGILTSADGCS